MAMDATVRHRAMELLGRFNDEMTRVVDDAFGTQWAEIEEILAILALVTDHAVTTRRLAERMRGMVADLPSGRACEEG